MAKGAEKAMEKEFVSTGELAQLLGLRMHQVLYLLSSGKIEEPELRVGGKRAWSGKDVDEARRVTKGGEERTEYSGGNAYE